MSWNRIALLTPAVIAGSLLCVACGSSESDGASGGTGASAGASGAAGAGATAGSGGSSSGGSGGSAGASGAAGSVAVDYVAAVASDSPALHVGKGVVKLELTTGAGPAVGLADQLALEPLMQMAMMAHGAPVPVDAVKESATPGIYDCTLFFPMASVDQNGQPQGKWSLKVGVGQDSAGTLDLTVSPPAGTDTTHVALKNAADTITSSGMPKLRSWFLFRDSLEATSGGHSFGVFLATQQEGLMVWPPVTVGLSLTDSSGTEQLAVQSLSVQASTDGTTWAPLTCDAKARCAGTLTGLSSGSTGTVKLKLSVNGADYTTDGSAPDASKNNGFATFSVTVP